jgi:hypothetical protein
MPAAEGRHAGLAEAGGCLRGGVGLQEGQGDLGAEPREDLLGTGPMSVQQGAELVAGGGLGLDVVLAQPHQGLELAGGGVQGIQSAQPVAVGAQVVGQLVAVTGVGLGTGRAPAGPGSVERGGVDRHHGVAGGQQPVNDQPTGLLDRYGQLVGLAVAGQPRERVGQSGLGVGRCPVVNHGAGVVDNGHVVGGAGPVPANKHRSALLLAVSLLLVAEASPGRRCLIDGPRWGDVLKPVMGSARPGRQNSNWPSSGGKTAGPSPDPRHGHDPTHVRIARRILHQ